MSIRSKTLMIVKSAGLSYTTAAKAFGVKPESSSSKLGRGLTKIDDLIKLCDYCGAHIFIETKDGVIIPITIEDLDK